MAFSLRPLATSFCVSISLVLAAGCGVGNVSNGSGAVTSMAQIQGRVHGGQQAISGASVQLYAANLTTFSRCLDAAAERAGDDGR